MPEVMAKSGFTGSMTLEERDPEMAKLVKLERERQTKCIVSLSFLRFIAVTLR